MWGQNILYKSQLCKIWLVFNKNDKIVDSFERNQPDLVMMEG